MKLGKAYSLISLVSLVSIYFVFLLTFLRAYFDPTKSTRVTINSIGEANVELLLFVLTTPYIIWAIIKMGIQIIEE